MQRICGGCTACCKTHGIEELRKPPGRWCRHCNIGRGCSIYKDRPKSCRVYACSWLQGVGRDEDRPDKINIVGEYSNADPLGPTLTIFEVEEGALSSEVCRRWSLNNLWNGNCVVHHALHGDHRLYLPRRLPVLGVRFAYESENEPIRQIPYEEALLQLANPG